MPEWLAAHPTEEGLRDAMSVVLKTQEMAGIDLLADGELNRYDMNHPEIEWGDRVFYSPVDECAEHGEPAGGQEVHGVDALEVPEPRGGGGGGADRGREPEPGAGFSAGAVADARPLKFTVTSPYMLGRVLLDKHYKSKEALIGALADVLGGAAAGCRCRSGAGERRDT